VQFSPEAGWTASVINNEIQGADVVDAVAAL